jgi:hypothetical protein
MSTARTIGRTSASSSTKALDQRRFVFKVRAPSEVVLVDYYRFASRLNIGRNAVKEKWRGVRVVLQYVHGVAIGVRVGFENGAYWHAGGNRRACHLWVDIDARGFGAFRGEVMGS